MASLKSSLRIYKKVSTNSNPLLSRLTRPSVDILSLHADQLLVGSKNRPELTIYSTTGSLIKTLTRTNDQSKCFDAVWTSQHYIVCTVTGGIKLIDASDGRILASYSALINHLGNSAIGVTPDNDIYISTLKQEIFTTHDHGYSWTALKQVPQLKNAVLREQALPIQNSDTFWSIERKSQGQQHDLVRVMIYYSNKTFREIYNKENVPRNNLHAFIYRLVGAVQLGEVLLIDELNKAVRVFNTAGEPEGQLTLPGIDSNVGPCSAAMDNQTLYLGMEDGQMHILTLNRM